MEEGEEDKLGGGRRLGGRKQLTFSRASVSWHQK